MKKLLGGFLAMLMLFKMSGCQKKPNVTDENVVGLSVSCTHMAFSYSYNFKIYVQENKTLFSCDCSIDRESYNDTRVSCKDVPIEDRYFDQLIEILKVNNVTEEVLKYKEKINWFFVADKTEYKITLFFENDKYKDASLHFEELYEFLKHLAGLYATEVTYE
ncbi:MAG: hypothetical protein ACOX1L_01445 [Erysipelotrichaceae bacterium]|jgi:hypothetical protein